jgi:glycosyltransferase involved in cell wall biosynthesis
MHGNAALNSRAPSISVIIPFHNAEQYLEGCLGAVSQSQGVNYELILVDDACTDSSPEIARRYSPEILTLSGPKGPAYARNRGAETARGSILFFMDADVFCNRDTLAIIEEQFQANPQLDAIIGSYDDDPPEKGFISRYKNLTHHFVHQQAAQEASTFWTGCGAIRSQVFADAGGFDETFARPSIEDIELGYRLRARGARIALCKRLVVKHAKKWTFPGLLRSDIFDRAIPWTRLQLSQGKLLNDLNLSLSQRWASIFVLLAMACGALALWRWQFLIALPGVLIPVMYWNRRLYLFYYRHGGFHFAAGSILMHWLYYLYSLGAFAWGYFIYRANLAPKKTGG